MSNHTKVFKLANNGASLATIMAVIHEQERGRSDVKKNQLELLNNFKFSERLELREAYKAHVDFAAVAMAQDNLRNLEANINDGERAYRKAFVELLLAKGSYIGFLESNYYGIMAHPIDAKQIFAIRNGQEATIHEFTGTFADADDVRVGISAEVLLKNREVEYIFAEVSFTEMIEKIRQG